MVIGKWPGLIQRKGSLTKTRLDHDVIYFLFHGDAFSFACDDDWFIVDVCYVDVSFDVDMKLLGVGRGFGGREKVGGEMVYGDDGLRKSKRKPERRYAGFKVDGFEDDDTVISDDGVVFVEANCVRSEDFVLRDDVGQSLREKLAKKRLRALGDVGEKEVKRRKVSEYIGDGEKVNKRGNDKRKMNGTFNRFKKNFELNEEGVITKKLFKSHEQVDFSIM